MGHSRRYCLITPCRDEARHARTTLEAVARQTVTPARWVIVDDGSRDETPAILREWARRLPYLRVLRRDDRGRRALGGGVIEAFDAGYATIDPVDYDYVCKLDLDLDLPEGYFEGLMARMERDPRIGTASGKPYFLPPGRALPEGARALPILDGSPLVPEVCGDENSVGMAKFYRTECFEQLGGFVRALMWDGIDCHRCRMLGWRAVSWDDPALRFHHLRPMGTSDRDWWTGRVRHGAGQWFMGTGPLYLLASALFRLPQPPAAVGSLGIVWGYLRAALRREPRHGDAAFRRFLRRYQRACLLRGKAAATRDLEARHAAAWQPPERPARRRAA